MAARVTPQEIVEMQRLYAELGTFAAVGRKMGGRNPIHPHLFFGFRRILCGIRLKKL